MWVKEGDVAIDNNTIEMPETSCVLCCKNGDVPPTGVKNVQRNESNGKVEQYTLDGRKATSSDKGIKIVRLANGKVVKM